MSGDLRRGALCGYEDACGRRLELECPFSTCDGCPGKPGQGKERGGGDRKEGEDAKA